MRSLDLIGKSLGLLLFQSIILLILSSQSYGAVTFSDDFSTSSLTVSPWSTYGDGGNTWTKVLTSRAQSAQAPEALVSSQTSTLQLQRTCSSVSTGNISFWFSVDSEQGFDFLRFYINDVEQGAWSGNIPWTHAYFPVVCTDTGQTKTFKWVFSKDATDPQIGSTVWVGLDTAWVDDIAVTEYDSSTPDQFTFTDVTYAARGTEYISSMITVTGIQAASAAISVTDGEYKFEGESSWRTAPTTVYNDDVVLVHQTSSSDYGVKTDTIVNIGGRIDTFSVTTEPAPDDWYTVNSPGSGLWHTETDADADTIISQGTRTLLPISGTTWWYGQGTDPDYNYNTGGRNYGSLITPPFVLGTDQNQALTFWSWERTEQNAAPGELDTRKIYISRDNSVTWTEIRELHSFDWDLWLAPHEEQWYNVNDLAIDPKYAGQSVRFKFTFDTVNSELNDDYRGWFLDEIGLTGSNQLTVSADLGSTGSGRVLGTTNQSTVLDLAITSPPNSNMKAIAMLAPGTITLTAIPDSGSAFTGWGGGCSGNGACIVTMSTEPIDVTAEFDLIPPPEGTVTIIDTGGFVGSSTVSLSLSCTDYNSQNCAQMRFSNDNIDWGQWESYAGSKNNFTLGASMTVYVQFRDSIGVVSSTVSDSTILDMTGPTGGSVTISDSGGFVSSTSVNLMLSCATSGSPCAQMQFSNDNSNWSSPQAYSTGATWNLSTGDGLKSVYVKFLDGVNNASTVQISDTTTLDTSGPTGGSVMINDINSYVSSTNVSLTLSCSSSGSPCAWMQFSNDNSNWSDPVPNATSASWDLSAGDGLKTVYVRFTDGVGNVSTVNSDTTTLDTAGPSGSLSIADTGGYVGSSGVTLNLTCSDSGSGCYQMRFNNNNTDWTGSIWVNNGSSASWTLTTGDGTKTVYAQFKDNLGNVSTVEISDITTLDITPPVGTISINNGEAITATTSVTLNLTCADGTGSGCLQMQFSNDNVTWSGWEAVGSTKAWTFDSNPGTKTVYVQFKDAMGNISLTSDAIELQASKYAVWADNTYGNYDIFLKSSTDNGASWTFTRFTENAGASVAPAIAVSGSNVYVAWQDNTYGNDEIFVKSSTNNGATWTFTRFTNNTGASMAPAIAVSGSNVYVAWQDNTYGNDEIFVKSSTNNGATWTFTRFTSNTGASVAPAIEASGSNVYVAWQDNTYGNDEIFVKSSTNNGATWTFTRFTNNTGASVAPAIEASGSNVYVAWQDNTYGNDEIFVKSSTNNGATWTFTRFTNNTGASVAPAIEASGSNVYVAWQDNTYGNDEIFVKSSTNNGATWTFTRFTSNTGASVAPAIAASGSNVYVAWQDNTYGNDEIFVKFSANNGASWTCTRFTNNDGISSSPAIY